MKADNRAHNVSLKEKDSIICRLLIVHAVNESSRIYETGFHDEDINLGEEP